VGASAPVAMGRGGAKMRSKSFINFSLQLCD